jgi:hypothetical protein
MSRIAFGVGSLMLLMCAFFAFRGYTKIKDGKPFFGDGGTAIYVYLGFGFFAIGLMLFLFGVFRLFYV